jgi:signal transduction histidine kinase
VSRVGTTPQSEMALLRGVRWRLVLWSSGLTLLVVVLLAAALFVAVSTSLRSAAISQLRDRAESLALALENAPASVIGSRIRIGDPSSRLGQAVLGPGFGGPASGTVALIIDRSGRPVAPNDQPLGDLVHEEGFEAALADGEDLREDEIEGIPVRIVSRRVETDDERFVLQIVQDRSGEERTLATLITVMTAGGLLAVAMALVAGLVYSQRALTPIRDAMRRQRDFAADASHELRTPLAVIGGNVEQLLRHPERSVGEVAEVLSDVRDEVAHLSTLTDDLLLLARADSGALELRSERIDLADVAAEALQRLQDLATARDVLLRLDGSPTRVEGDPDRLRQLVAILTDNAIRHSPEGGTVVVSVKQAANAQLDVEDEGPGIREEDRERIFDRFWRGRDAPSGGVGLGLAIAAWIVEQHGGVISVENRPAGGARFSVRLPGA